MDRGVLNSILRRGLWGFIILVALAAGEYALAQGIAKGNLPYMIIMNLVDAALIVYFFMHVVQLWRKEE